MRTELLDYKLPPGLIAQQPLAVRSRCRLLVVNRQSGKLTDAQFDHIDRFLRPGDCLVLNDTKVLQAKFFARRASGARLEGLFVSEGPDRVWTVYLKGLGKVRIGETIRLRDRKKADFSTAEVIEKLSDGKCRLQMDCSEPAEAILSRIGFPPLPPYIKRNDDAKKAAVDKVRYQTVYARNAGAVAAPTAGLHFTKRLIGSLKRRGIRFAYVTLHVGPGTFRPITARSVEEHQMESERFSISTKNAEVINETKHKGGRIIAVGSTSVRTLESAATARKVRPLGGETTLFISPGYRFNVVDGTVTNFHLPKSTLLALVAAFAGPENILSAYRHAIEQRYRFYSYGDAMLIL